MDVRNSRYQSEFEKIRRDESQNLWPIALEIGAAYQADPKFATRDKFYLSHAYVQLDGATEAEYGAVVFRTPNDDIRVVIKSSSGLGGHVYQLRNNDALGVSQDTYLGTVNDVKQSYLNALETERAFLDRLSKNVLSTSSKRNVPAYVRSRAEEFKAVSQMRELHEMLINLAMDRACQILEISEAPTLTGQDMVSEHLKMKILEL